MKDFFGNIATKNFNLDGVLSMATKAAGALGSRNPIGNALNKVTGLIGQARNLIKHPPLGALKSLATGGIGRLLSSRGIMSALPAGLGSLLGGGLGGSGGLGGLGNLGLPSLGQGCSGSGLGSGLLGSALKRGEQQLGSLLGRVTDTLESSLGQQGSGLLTGLTSRVTSFVSGRVGMVTALRSSACNGEF